MRASIYGHHPSFARLPGKAGDRDAYLDTADQWVAAMFAGSKAGLKPLYDALLECGLSIAKDVKACPCRTIVPFYRHHVIAQIGIACEEHPTAVRSEVGETARIVDVGPLLDWS